MPSPSSSSAASNNSCIEFFVRLFAGSPRTLVLLANADDTICSVHERIESLTRIPLKEQCLVYKGNQLQPEQTLHNCGVQNDDFIHLIQVRGDREHRLEMTWKLANDIVSYAISLSRNQRQPPTDVNELIGMVVRFFAPARKQQQGHHPDQAWDYVQIFNACSVPQALVMLYMSSDITNKTIGGASIKMVSILTTFPHFPTTFQYQCLPVLLEFCHWLRRASRGGPSNDNDSESVYCRCRADLGRLVMKSWESCMMPQGSSNIVFGLGDLIPFVVELATMISDNLKENAASPSALGPHPSDVIDFSAFLVPLRNEIMASCGPIKFPLDKEETPELPACHVEVVILLHRIFVDLLSKAEKVLMKIEASLWFKRFRSCQYLPVLKELRDISKLYHGCEELFWETMRRRKEALRYLMVTAVRYGEYNWVLEFKEATDFETRRHLAMKMLPKVKYVHQEKMFPVLIDRSKLLPSSFQCVRFADPKSLRDGLLIEFENEEATGFGVLREWFLLVCQAIVNPECGLFVACPNDRRRFFPSAASKVNPLHLEYFSFSGRVIALALMWKVQVGILLDRVFFLQLAGHDDISLEDIQDADPSLYSSCKQILEMDPKTIDQDVLGLTFVHETEEFGGERKIIELCPGGSSIVVNSKNRKLYVDSLIRHIFVTAISEQVAYFAQGFTDIVGCQSLQNSFFQCLYMEDLDWILHGSESEISVDDWKGHTEYHGFEKTDRQISWFWKVVRSMTKEQKKVLLFFWTSIKYLPFEGFSGLTVQLCIHKTSGSLDRLPSSSTCVYQLCFPAYNSFSVMRDRLHVITQGHIGCSFGTK